MTIQIVRDAISKAELSTIANEIYGDMIKIVVDIESEVIAVGGEYHADAEEELLKIGAKQENLWGCNIYLNQPKETWIDYTALINIRPRQNNLTMEINNKNIKEMIKKIIHKRIK